MVSHGVPCFLHALFHFPGVVSSWWLITLLVGVVVLPTTGLHELTSCVNDIPRYYYGVSVTNWTFAPNPCGFHTLSRDEIVEALFSKNGTVVFAGDSTVLRGYIWLVNRILNTTMPVSKLAETPPAIVRVDPRNASRRAYFFRMQFMADLSHVLCAIASNPQLAYNRVLVYFSIGNYDMNWKMHKTVRMPCITRAQDPAEAQRCWNFHVNKSMTEVGACLGRRRTAQLSMMTFIAREQWLPNCKANRFSAKNRRFRDCSNTWHSMIPWYRSVLHPRYDEVGILRISIDHMFRNESQYCGLGDGIHVDPACKEHELMMLWNAYQWSQAQVEVARGKTVPYPTILVHRDSFHLQCFMFALFAIVAISWKYKKYLL